MQQSAQTARALPPIGEREWHEVLWDVSESGILSITLNRPERLNALTFRLLREVSQLIEHARTTPEIRVVALRGSGTRAFCSGDDLKGMEADPAIDSSQTVHHPLLLAIRDLPKPVVALIEGFALGHGFELACACDIRICAHNLDAGDHRVYRSIGMNGGTSWFLPRIIGHGRALELLMTGAHMNAEQAEAWGWANRVWPLADFDARAAEYLGMLAGLPTIASGAFKAAVEFSSGHGLRESLANELVVASRIRGTDDAAEGRRSFHEKRVPHYSGG